MMLMTNEVAKGTIKMDDEVHLLCPLCLHPGGELVGDVEVAQAVLGSPLHHSGSDGHHEVRWSTVAKSFNDCSIL